MKARSIRVNSVEEVKAFLTKESGEGFKPTLAFVFISIAQDIDGVRQVLDQAGVSIFGATSSGEFIDGELGAGSIAMLLLDLDRTYFHLMLEDYEGRDMGGLAEEMATAAVSRYEHPAFILSCSFDVIQSSADMGEDMLRAIEKVAGSDSPIWGGRAGDDFRFQKSVVFNGERSTTSGILLLVLDGDRVDVKGQSVSGQKAIGIEKVITKAVNNWVFEIDHQPAADVVMKFLGLQLTQEQAETFNPADIVFSLIRDKGEPVLRGVGVFNWMERSFSILGRIREGDKVKMTLPPDFEVMEEETRDAERIRDTVIPDPDALLVFNCMGRLGLFGPMAGDEVENLRNVFGVPMAGFFTYGEFGRAEGGDNEFHNNTCCWVALKEK